MGLDLHYRRGSSSILAQSGTKASSSSGYFTQTHTLCLLHITHITMYSWRMISKTPSLGMCWKHHILLLLVGWLTWWRVSSKVRQICGGCLFSLPFLSFIYYSVWDATAPPAIRTPRGGSAFDVFSKPLQATDRKLQKVHLPFRQVSTRWLD